MTSLPRLHTVQIRDTEIHYVEKGSGDTVVFVHGSLAGYSTWQNQLPVFGKYYRAIAYSRRYHHPNKWVGDGADYSAALHAEDLAELIVALAGGRAHIIGSSYGAYTALVLAVRRSELVRSLTLAEPPIMPWLDGSEEGKVLRKEFDCTAWEPAGEAFKHGEMARGVKLFLNGVIGRGTYERLSAASRKGLLNNALEMKAETSSQNYFTPVAFREIRRLSMPVLLLSGEKSPRMFHLIMEHLIRCLSLAPHFIIPDASHSMHSQNPEAYNDVVLKFLLQTKE